MSRQDYLGNGDGNEPYESGDEHYEECEVCHQEFTGTCPINSADCPYADNVDDDKEDTPDFEDVENLDALLEDDEEVEKLIEEEDDLPADVLMDEDATPGEDGEDDAAPPKPDTAASSPRTNRSHGQASRAGKHKK